MAGYAAQPETPGTRSNRISGVRLGRTVTCPLRRSPEPGPAASLLQGLAPLLPLGARVGARAPGRSPTCLSSRANRALFSTWSIWAGRAISEGAGLESVTVRNDRPTWGSHAGCDDIPRMAPERRIGLVPAVRFCMIRLWRRGPRRTCAARSCRQASRSACGRADRNNH
jgi:hypothetical protein